MKKSIFSLAVAAVAALTASASTTLDVRGTVYNVDTVFHAKVGPGTTQTSLQLRSTSNPLNVFYLTIDRTVPGVSIRSVCATDKVAGTERTSTMAKRKSVNGLDYFAGVNADFFSTSGYATNGSSKIGTPTTSCIVDGEIYKTSNSNYQFSIDAEGIARVCRFDYYTGTATIGDKVTLFKGVNVMSPNNGITIYTPRFWGTANQNEYADACHQVTAKLVEGDEFIAGGKFRLVVTSEPTTHGDLPIPADGFVIHGRGTSKTGCNTGATNFVGALHVGDIVEFDNIVLTPDGERIYPRTVVSGNPKNVGGGLTLDTEGERTDASARHPRTSIGVSEDGSKIIMMVIDGRGQSVGVTTSMLADVMRFAGAYEAVNLDGGGSSTLYTEALGVRNTCSDGSERAVGNAIFAVLEAPDDNTVTEIAFADWRKSVPYLGTYQPVVYAYNKYGKLIDNNYKNFTLSCAPELGELSENGQALTATGSGTHVLKATTPDGIEAQIIVTVADTAPIEPTLPAVLLNATREWEVQLHSVVDGTKMTVAPAAFEWTSSDPDVATVTIDGIVKGVADGTCTVTGSRPGMTIPVAVTIEVPKDTHHHIEATPDADAWTCTGVSTKISNFAANTDNSYSIDYTLSATRGPSITLSRKVNLWSHPNGLEIKMDAANAKVTSVYVNVKAANSSASERLTIDNVAAANETYTVSFVNTFDLDDVAVYPLQLSNLLLNLSGSTNTPYHIDFESIRAQYDESTVDGVIDIAADRPAGLPFALDAARNIIIDGMADNITITDINGRTLLSADNTATLSTATLPAGIYVVSLTLGDTLHTAKILLP